MYNLLRKNDGFLLITAYFSIFVLIVLTAVLFSQATNEHILAGRSFDGLAAMYAAQQGIDYVLTEIKYNPDFFTHISVEEPPDSDIYRLDRDSVPLTPDLDNVIIDDDGYKSNFPEGQAQFIVKTYLDPIGGTDEIIILSLGSSGNGTTSRLFVSKYIPSSLYKFFYFSPKDLGFYGGQFDASGGGIHANGWLIFKRDATFSNISEMSTAEYFKYYVKGHVPEGNAPDGTPWQEVFWNWRDPWSEPNNNNTDPYLEYLNYLNKPDGHNYGNKYGLLTNSGDEWDGNFESDICYPSDPACHSLYAQYTSINGVDIPSWLPTNWSWNQYWELENGYHSLGQTWYYPGNDISVDHFNTEYQYTDWESFLTGAGSALDGIARDSNTGGSHIEPPSIGGSTEYSLAAYEGGIIITGTEVPSGSGNWNMFVIIKGGQGGAPIPLPQDGEISIGGETVFEHETFTDVNTGEFKPNVVKVNIKALKDAFDDGGHGSLTEKIIYSNMPVAISEAESITQGGLTVVGADNVYLHGNYNTGTDSNDYYAGATPEETIPRPSAVITAKDVYTLSDFFYGFNDAAYGFWPDGYVPVPQQNFNFPYEHNFYCPQDDMVCSGILTNPEGNYKRPEDEVFHDDYPAGRNWYWDSNNAACGIGIPNYFCMANPIPNGEDYYYNVAMVGYRGFEPKVLERWYYIHEDNIGDADTPPSTYGARATRTITGAFIQLEQLDFEPVYPGFDNAAARGYCVGGNPFGYCRNPDYLGWAWNMTNHPPTNDSNYFKYETQFSEGILPPGGLIGFSAAAILELDNTEDNWNFHYNPISAPSS